MLLVFCVSAMLTSHQCLGQTSDAVLAEKSQAAASTSPDSGSEAGEGASETTFLRMTKDEQGEPKTLETAVVRYSSGTAGGATVDLIGAVHIAEPGYYSALNQQFDQYDVLLYELVAPEGTQLPRGGPKRSEGFNPVAMLQDLSKDLLGLASQLECVDYTKEHFVRADMTPTQIADKMKERGDTPMTIALDTLAEVMRQQNLAASDPDSPLRALESEASLSELLGDPLKMKRMLARQFVETGSLDQSLGNALNQLLIVDRNEAALKELQKQLAKGKRRIGIFYGAAHLPDLEKHLADDFGLVKTQQDWLAAWDLQNAQSRPADSPAGMFLNLLRILE